MRVVTPGGLFDESTFAVEEEAVDEEAVDHFPHFTRIRASAAAAAKSSPYGGKGVGKGGSSDGDKGGFSDGKTRFGQMCKKQHMHGDQIEELQRVILLQTKKLKEQQAQIGQHAQRHDQQELRLERQERKMTWLLQQLDRALPLPVGGEEPSEH